MSDEVERQASGGRHAEYFARGAELRRQQRAGYARLLGCEPEELALTTCTTEGIATVVAGFGRGDTIVTSDEEHPGVYGPLGAARERGAKIVVTEFDCLADAVDVSTTAIVCSHVSWVSGALAPAELASVGVPVIYDGAQGIGAIPVRVEVLGCAAYAGSGQKWLCGPDGSGMLYLAPEFRERVPTLLPAYANRADPAAGLEAEPWPDGRAWDTPVLSGESSRYALASLEVLATAGWDEVHTRGVELAARLAAMLAERGHTVLPRGDTTLVTWECVGAEGVNERARAEGVNERARAEGVNERARAAGVNERARAAGVLIRSLPGRELLRASVGAWNDESDLERLLEVL